MYTAARSRAGMDALVARNFGQSPVCGDQHVSIAQNTFLVVLDTQKNMPSMC